MEHRQGWVPSRVDLRSRSLSKNVTPGLVCIPKPNSVPIPQAHRTRAHSDVMGVGGEVEGGGGEGASLADCHPGDKHRSQASYRRCDSF